jgi:hypothetical protein
MVAPASPRERDNGRLRERARGAAVPQLSTAGLALTAALGILAFEAHIFEAHVFEAHADVPDVPGDDIFGFTTPTDVGNPGETGFANENDGRMGKRAGRYHALNAKYELGHTFAPDWWIGASLYASRHRVRDVPGLVDVRRIAFDGLSFELERRIVKRSVTNPFAVSVSVEPRWSRVESTSGEQANAIDIAFKLFVDAVLVPDKVFWAFNASWAPQRAEDPSYRSRWLSSSGVLLSTAIAYQMSPKLFVGGEARYLASFSTLFPRHEVGHAVYVGPTLLWKVTDKVAFNTTFQPQVAGRSTANPGLRLDLDNFERAQFRAKVVVAFQ